MEFRGYQVFVVHPSLVIRDSLVEALRTREYETFGLSDMTFGALDKRRDAIVFLHVGKGDFHGFSQELHQLRITNHLVAIGTDIVPSGFDGAITGSEQDLLSGILRYLETVHAQGHRHYVRFGSQNASIATFEFHIEGQRFAGIVHDISVAAMSCTFRPEPESLPSQGVPAMQLNLPGFRALVSGRFTTKRLVSGQTIHVFLFYARLDDETRKRIYDFVYSSLALKMDLGS